MGYLILLGLLSLFAAGTPNPTNDDIVASMIFATMNSTTPTPNSQTTPLSLRETNEENSVYCKLDDNETGVCVMYYLCNSENKTIITDGSNILDTRATKCPNYLERCCKRNDILDVRNKDSDGTSVATAANECGWSDPGLKGDKNAVYAEEGEFPWMVAILKKSGSSAWSHNDYLGGGTLIHPSVVMTAAHKVVLRKTNERNEHLTIPATELKCRAGEWDTQTESESYPHQDRDVARYIVHEDFYRTSYYNNIALLILARPFELTNAPHIGVACVGSAPPVVGRDCFSMGWGRVSPTDTKAKALTLKKVLLTPWEHRACEATMKKIRFGGIFKLHQSLMCASGSENVDTCRGDGGSPLACAVTDGQGRRRFAVVGMVVVGLECFNSTIPGIYTNTVHLKSWVDETMKKAGYNANIYTV